MKKQAAPIPETLSTETLSPEPLSPEPLSTEPLSTETPDAAPAPSPLERMLDEAERAPRVLPPAGETHHLVGEVVDDAHPSLRGRVRVRWTDLEGQTFEKWLATLMGLPVRVADRVLLTQPANYPERVVTGVLDGFARRPEVPKEEAAALVIQRDEALRVRSAAGDDLLELFEGDDGPVVKLLTGDVDLEIPGRMRVRAHAIELEATQGQARIKASDDVVVRGEVVHLN